MRFWSVLFGVLLCSSIVFAARLPTDGGDTDAWGPVLNEYLRTLAGENATVLNETIVNSSNLDAAILINTSSNISTWDYFCLNGDCINNWTQVNASVDSNLSMVWTWLYSLGTDNTTHFTNASTQSGQILDVYANLSVAWVWLNGLAIDNSTHFSNASAQSGQILDVYANLSTAWTWLNGLSSDNDTHYANASSQSWDLANLNASKAATGNCSTGQFVQNSTIWGVYCAAPPSGSEVYNGTFNETEGAYVYNSTPYRIDFNETLLNETVGLLANGTFVPYTGATDNVDLGVYNLTTTGSGRFSYTDKLDQVAAPGIPPANTLRLYSEDVKGFSFYSFIDDTGMTRKLVRDSVIVVKNVGGTTIPALRIVYASGSEDQVPTIALAKADSAATMPAIGVTLESITNGSYGRVMQVGLLENVNTSSFSEGDSLYVSDVTAGVPINTIPLVPSLKQEIGTILVKDPVVGAIQIVARSVHQDETGSAQNTWRLGDGLAGNKTIAFNNGTNHNLTWDDSNDRFELGNSLNTQFDYCLSGVCISNWTSAGNASTVETDPWWTVNETRVDDLETNVTDLNWSIYNLNQSLAGNWSFTLGLYNNDSTFNTWFQGLFVNDTEMNYSIYLLNQSNATIHSNLSALWVNASEQSSGLGPEVDPWWTANETRVTTLETNASEQSGQIKNLFDFAITNYTARVWNDQHHNASLAGNWSYIQGLDANDSIFNTWIHGLFSNDTAMNYSIYLLNQSNATIHSNLSNLWVNASGQSGQIRALFDSSQANYTHRVWNDQHHNASLAGNWSFTQGLHDNDTILNWTDYWQNLTIASNNNSINANLSQVWVWLEALGADNTTHFDNASTQSGQIAALEYNSGFRAYNSSAMAIKGLSVWSKIRFDTENWDNKNEWDTSSTARFTANTAGVYHACVHISCNTYFTLRISQNGVTNSSHTGSNTIIADMGLCDDFNMAAGDYLEVWAAAISPPLCYAGSASTHFSVHKVS